MSTWIEAAQGLSAQTLAHVVRVYEGSDGEATKGLYARLELRGPAGFVAVNLFRAQKNSERAKVYSGGIRGQGSYRGMAYDRKQWAMNQLCNALLDYSERLSIGWGCGIDPLQEFHRHVLYVELPCGQVSFHTDKRGIGPDHSKEWDGVRGMSQQRICAFVARVLDTKPSVAAQVAPTEEESLQQRLMP